MIKPRHAFFSALFTSLTLPLAGCKLDLLDPKGAIAADEKSLLITAVLLMLIVVVPVIVLTLIFAWRYRAGNTKAAYSPNWSHSTWLEVVCWTVPCIIIGILGVMTWTTSHQLDPYRPLTTSEKPLTIEAISLEWKWLFIYPELNIATVNYLQLPVNTPVRFLITADGPMNSFQVPQLAGQIYAMAGMQTRLNLIADAAGDYRGQATNYTGDGFSDMNFNVKVTSREQFDQWVKSIEKSSKKLTLTAFNDLSKPSEKNPVEYFSSPRKDLFATLMMKSMMPMNHMDEYASNQKSSAIHKS